MAFDYRRSKLLKLRADLKAERRAMRRAFKEDVSIEEYRLHTFFFDSTQAKARDA